MTEKEELVCELIDAMSSDEAISVSGIIARIQKEINESRSAIEALTEKQRNLYILVKNDASLCNFAISRINGKILQSKCSNSQDSRKMRELFKKQESIMNRRCNVYTTLPSYLQFDKDQAEIIEIVELIKKHSCILISGYAGIGKTVFAQSLLYVIIGSYDSVAWIPYKDTFEQSILSSVQLYEYISDAKERIQAIIDALKYDGRRKLIVIDNVDFDAERKQNPANDSLLQAITGWPNTTVIVTSRLNSLGACYYTYYYNHPSLEACLDLFFRFCEHPRTPENEETAKAIIALAQCHTLTVELLAKGANCESNLSSYYDKLKGDAFAFPEIENEADKDKVMTTIAEILKILLNLQISTQEQTKFLQCFATLPKGTQISKDEISEWFGFGINVYDPLVKAGWISQNEGMYAMHPLVKEIILLDELPEDTADQFLSFIEDSHNNYFLSGEVYTATMRKIEIAESVLTTLPDTLNKDTTQFASIYHNIASAYMQLADYDKALAYFHKALIIRETRLGTDHPSTAATYDNIAGIYHAKGYNIEALEYYEKALQIREGTLVTDHPDTATTYNNIAGVYQAMGDYDNALSFYQKALRIREAKLGTDHPSTATTYNNIAVVYQDKGEYDNALCFYRKALIIYETKLGTDHPVTATTYNNIAIVYQDKGEYDNALCFYQKALRIRGAKLGQDHPDTATTYNNIAGVYKAKGDYDNALSFYQKALKICEAKLGTDHPNTAATYNNIAGVYQAKGDYDNALSFYQKDLHISEAKLGSDHPDTATTYNNIAAVYQDKGDYDKALSFYQKALNAKEKTIGTDHPSTAITYANIGILQYQTGFYYDGLGNLLKSYLVFASRFGFEHPYTKAAFSWLPDCYIAAYPDGEAFEDWLQKQLDANTEE